MVRGLTRQRLELGSRSPWRAKLALQEEVLHEWRRFYKPPFSKKVADLQWRLFYGILAVNNFMSTLNPNTCLFCGAIVSTDYGSLFLRMSSSGPFVQESR